jgi:hypothetical protein
MHLVQIQSQQYNRPIPNTLFPFEFEQNNNALNQGYYFATPSKIGSQPNSIGYIKPSVVLYDTDGYVYWYLTPNSNGCLDFKFYPLSNIYSFTSNYGPNNNPDFFILDSNLNYIDTINTIGTLEDVHDIQKLNNGNWMVSAIYSDTLDLTGYTFNGVTGKNNTPIKGFGLQEIDINNNVVFEWNSNDYIHPSETYDEYGYDSTFFDYCHGNAVEEDFDGNLLISLRHLNSIYKINRTNGDVIWKLGGKSSDFIFSNGDFFSGQHDIRALDNGNYSLFDNGNMSPDPKVSRGVEYLLDTISWTANIAEQYIHSDSIYSRAMGSYQTTINDNKLLGYGLTFRPNPSATIIDNNQNSIAEFIFQDSVVSYRFLHFTPTLPPRTQISCEQTLTGLRLWAPSSNSYLWSTGDTTESIMVTSMDTIQVWTPYGSGFIGSEPLIIDDINEPCGYSAINENSIIEGNEKYVLYNLLGQPVLRPKENQIYIKVYESGRTKKTIHQLDY